MSFTELFRDISGLLSGAELVDAVNGTASVINNNGGIDISLDRNGASIIHHIDTNEEEHFSLLKKALIYSSDFNHASRNGVLKFPFPKNKKELLSYIENRDIFLNTLYRKDKSQLASHDSVQIPNFVFDELVEQETVPKKKNTTTSGGTSNSDVTMSFDELVSSVETSEKSHSEKSNSISMER